MALKTLVGQSMDNIQDYDDSEEEIGPPVPEEYRINYDDVEMKNANDTQHGERDEKGQVPKEYEQDEIEPPVPKEYEQDEIGPPVPKEYEQDEIGPPVPKEYEQDEIGPPVPKEYEQDDEIGPPVPREYEEGSDIGPPVPEDYEQRDSDSDESDEEEMDVNKDIPITSNVTMAHGIKPVVALSLDPSGTRLASGSVDYDVRFWDFAGMDSTLQSFRTLTPCGNNPIKALDYSATGDNVLVISGMSQAKVLDRDGHEKFECIKGDQYVSDMAMTKGHVAPLTSGCWHPRVREEFLTTALDSTCRVWVVKRPSKHIGLIKCRAKNGLKTNPTACCYNRDGTIIACACVDGSVQLWDRRKAFVNPLKMLRDAHSCNTETSSVTFSYGGFLIATRGGDDTLKLWDMRNFKKSLFEVDNLYSRYSSTNCMFSPNDSLLMTGVSVEKGESEGKVFFYDTKTLSLSKSLDVCDSHVIQVNWHPRLQQIFMGCGDGTVRAYYGEAKTGRGAQLCAQKNRKKSKQVEVIAAQQIITPHALPMFRQEKQKSTRKKLEKERLDPVKSRRPDLPINSGQGGRVAASGSTLSSYVIRNLGLSKRVDDDQDPREAILRFAKEAEENPYWIAPAYKKTQPKTIFQTEATDDKDQPATKKTKM
ncbi:gastrulation defective protein 1 homolog isoform X2 [Cimex lectularius]|uniref:WD repeat-containing protein 55 homolog n=1 Tax=Cimex lectularius TaxID=79782 RepID=A0A8I6TMD9_CIMLE|nr:gastrulation defective protein 1 homolog isoform X2 [Cimex lectularius]